MDSELDLVLDPDVKNRNSCEFCEITSQKVMLAWDFVLTGVSSSVLNEKMVNKHEIMSDLHTTSSIDIGQYMSLILLR